MEEPEKTKNIVFPYNFDPEKRRLSKIYLKQRVFLGLTSGFLLQIIFFSLILFSGFNEVLRDFSLQFGFFSAIVFFFTLATLLNLLSFPFQFYSGFIFEHKYKLSNYSLKGWFKDYFKGMLVFYVISIPLFWLFYFIINATPFWWAIAAAASVAIALFFDFIAPVILLPFFYKLKPFANEQQKKRLLEIANSVGSKNIETILVAEESEKSKKPNAMFTGLGKTKRIVLFDTLLDNFTPDEIETVIAHELAHYHFKDIFRELSLETLKSLVLLFIVNGILLSSIGFFGILSRGDLAGFPLIALALIPLDFLSEPLMNAYSRRRELEADKFALDTVKKPEAQASTEKRLADMALSDDNPEKIVEWVFFTHPAAGRRIKLAEDWMKN